MNKTKYECKRCKHVSLIKIPNCQNCSSSEGYNKIKVIPDKYLKAIKESKEYLQKVKENRIELNRILVTNKK